MVQSGSSRPVTHIYLLFWLDFKKKKKALEKCIKFSIFYLSMTCIHYFVESNVTQDYDYNPLVNVLNFFKVGIEMFLFHVLKFLIPFWGIFEIFSSNYFNWCSSISLNTSHSLLPTSLNPFHYRHKSTDTHQHAAFVFSSKRSNQHSFRVQMSLPQSQVF